MTDLNDIFTEFARAFVGTVTDDREVAFPEELPRNHLDGSLESLHHVDRYLTLLHQKRNQLSEDQWHITVLRAGAYLGEVIRHAAPEGTFNWVDYNEYMPLHPELQPLIPERSSGTCAFLVRSSGAMSMPLNKIARYIEDGSEHSVHFFAVCDLRPPAKGGAA